MISQMQVDQVVRDIQQTSAKIHALTDINRLALECITRIAGLRTANPHKDAQDTVRAIKMVMNDTDSLS